MNSRNRIFAMALAVALFLNLCVQVSAQDEDIPFEDRNTFSIEMEPPIDPEQAEAALGLSIHLIQPDAVPTTLPDMLEEDQPETASRNMVESIQSGRPWFDGNNEPIQASEGSLLQADGLWYWYGSPAESSSFVNCYTSDDLYNWQYQDPVFSFDGILRNPKVIYDSQNDSYVLWSQMMDTNSTRAVVAISDSPLGPFEFHSETVIPEGGNLNLFLDEDEAAYLYNRMDDDLWLYPLDNTYTGIRLSRRIPLTPTKEQQVSIGTSGTSSVLFKNCGVYYLLTSGGEDSTRYAMATSIRGPWKDMGAVDAGDELPLSRLSWVLPLEPDSEKLIIIRDEIEEYNNDDTDRRYSAPIHTWMPLGFSLDGSLSMRYKDEWMLEEYLGSSTRGWRFKNELPTILPLGEEPDLPANLTLVSIDGQEMEVPVLWELPAYNRDIVCTVRAIGLLEDFEDGYTFKIDLTVMPPNLIYFVNTEDSSEDSMGANIREAARMTLRNPEVADQPYDGIWGYINESVGVQRLNIVDPALNYRFDVPAGEYLLLAGITSPEDGTPYTIRTDAVMEEAGALDFSLSPDITGLKSVAQLSWLMISSRDETPIYREGLSMPETITIDGAQGTEASIPLVLYDFPSDDFRSIQGIIELPKELELVGMVPSEIAITDSLFFHNQSGNELRFVWMEDIFGITQQEEGALTAEAFEALKESIAIGASGIKNFSATDDNEDAPLRRALTVADTSEPLTIATITVQLKQELEAGTALTIQANSFNATRDVGDVQEIPFVYATTTLHVGEEPVQSAVSELYVGDDTNLIPAGKRAVSIVLPNAPETSGATLGEVQLYRSPQRSREDTTVYVGLVDSDTDVKVENITLNNSESATVLFGDVNADELVNAQDALNILDAWLRKTEAPPTDVQILRMNTTADGGIDTNDALAVVDHFINSRQFEVTVKK